MNLSHAYSAPPPREVAETVVRIALDLGVTHFDSAALYGFGANEELLAPVLKPHRARIVLASKCGMFRNDAGMRVIDGRPDVLRRTCDDSLRRLQTDVIDLYYLHRKDPNVPDRRQHRCTRGSRAAGKDPGDRRVGSVSGDHQEGPRRASDCRRPERVLTLDAKPGDRGAGRVP